MVFFLILFIKIIYVLIIKNVIIIRFFNLKTLIFINTYILFTYFEAPKEKKLTPIYFTYSFFKLYFLYRIFYFKSVFKLLKYKVKKKYIY